MPTTGGRHAQAADAIALLALLSSMGGRPLPRHDACERLGLDGEGLQGALDTLAALSNRETGARAVVLEDARGLALLGDAAAVPPLRLTLEESMVLEHVLAAVALDDATRDRIERALLPMGLVAEAAERLADDAYFGPHYLALDEAVRDGVRCRVAYRSDAEEAPSERVVDPLALQVVDGVAYLDAWDVKADGQRRYRLDRMTDVVLTDDSVERRDWRRDTPAESLRRAGKVATLAFSSERALRQRRWAGLGEARVLPSGHALAELSYTSEEWLFDQVIGGSGDVMLLSPADLRDRFVAYAQNLRL